MEETHFGLTDISGQEARESADSHGARCAISLHLGITQGKKPSKYGLFVLACLLMVIKSKTEALSGDGGEIMKHIIKSIGDREIAWIMLAVAAMAIWSTWGIIS